MKLVRFEIKPHSKCPVMRLLVVMISIFAFITPARAIKPRVLARKRVQMCATPGVIFSQDAPRTALRMVVSDGLIYSRSSGRRTGKSHFPLMCAKESEAEHVRPEKVLILGAGWVGSRLAARLSDEGMEVGVTNRPGTGEKVKPPYFRPVTMSSKVKPRVLFEVNDKATWANLPPASEYDAIVVTFPLVSQSCIELFDKYLRHAAHVVCYSSTSVYQVGTQ